MARIGGIYGRFMGHPSIETRESPLYVKSMLLSLYAMSICDAMETCQQALVSQMKRSSAKCKKLH